MHAVGGAMGQRGERFSDKVGSFDGFPAETTGGAKLSDGTMGTRGEVAAA